MKDNRIVDLYWATRRVSLKKWRDIHRDKRGGGEVSLALDELSECVPSKKSLLIKSQALFENFCEVILWHNSKTASSAGQKESRNRRNDYSFCSRLRRCAFTLP